MSYWQNANPNKSVVPATDDAYDLGSDSNRWRRVIGDLVAGWGGDTFPTVPVAQSGGVFGLNVGPGTEDVDFGGGPYEPTFMAVKAETTAVGATAQAEHLAGGSIMMGSAFAGDTGRAEILSYGTSYGMFVGGYAFLASGAGTARLYGGPGGSGSFLWAYVSKSGAGTSVAQALGYGCFVQGRIQGAGTHTIQATGNGGFAQGISEGGSGSSLIEAITGSGGFAQGCALNGGVVRASGDGAFAQGIADTATGEIIASGDGAFAKGDTGANTISATAIGSFAFGNASAGDISATASNAVQFGPGTNGTADSVQVGAGFVARAGGQFGGANDPLTLPAAATTFATTSNVMTITGDAGTNTIATITGGVSGQHLTLIFTDGLVAITDDNTHAADTIDLSAAFTSADDTVLQLVYDGTSWYEVSRSVN